MIVFNSSKMIRLLLIITLIPCFRLQAQNLISLNTRLEFLNAISSCVGSPDQCPTFGTTIAPFSGKHYIGIHEYPYTSSGEAISAKLNTPLMAGNTYTYSVMAAIAPITAWGAAPNNGDNNGVIYVYGGTTSCDKTQLIDSITLFTPADRNKWRQFTFNFTATANHTHLSFFTKRKASAYSYMVLDDAIRFDFGDAPDTYKTMITSNGARHQLFGPNLSPLIGSVVDWEEDGFPGATLTGDDNNGSVDDEDGFTSLPDLSQSQTQYSLNNILVKNTTGKIAYLVGWIDFNKNGVFESTEAAVTTVPSSGAINVNLNWSGFSIPSIGVTYARFRISTDTTILNSQVSLCKPTGLALDGEVEDYMITINNCNPIKVSPDTSICIGDSISLQAYDADSYSWSPVQGLSCINCPNPKASPLTTTTYTVTGSQGTCPPSSANVIVSVLEPPKVQVGPSQTIFKGKSVVIKASGGVNYRWFYDNSKGDTLLVSPVNTEVFCVEVTDNNGCLDTACATITVEPMVSSIWVPNVFTPNDDSYNNLFRTPGVNIIEYYIVIYNRWGNLIYESNDIEKGWDGTYHGVPVPDGVYAYKIQALGADNKKYIKIGMVHVIR